MTGPLAEIVTLPQPSAPLSKLVSGADAWRVDRASSCTPFYCITLEGSARLAISGRGAMDMEQGDFVLIPAAEDFTMSGIADHCAGNDPPAITHLGGETRHGDPMAPANVKLLLGHFEFGSPDPALLVSLLPDHSISEAKNGLPPSSSSLPAKRAGRPSTMTWRARPPQS